MSREEVSIIMNTYRSIDSQRNKWIKDTIKSIKNQKKVDVQFIIIDDGSDIPLSESDMDGAEYYYIERSGRNVARNLGLSKVKGIGFSTIGDDDKLPNDLSLYNRLNRFTSSYNPALIWTRAINSYPDKNVVTCPNEKTKSRYGVPLYVENLDNYPYHGGTLFIASKYVSKYKIKLRWCSESDFLYRILKLAKIKGECAYSYPEITYKYTVSHSEKKYTIPVRRQLLKLIKLYKNYYNLPKELINIWNLEKKKTKLCKNPFIAVGKNNFITWLFNEGINKYQQVEDFFKTNWENRIVTHNLTVRDNIDWYFNVKDSDLISIQKDIRNFRKIYDI